MRLSGAASIQEKVHTGGRLISGIFCRATPQTIQFVEVFFALVDRRGRFTPPVSL
jgi:hypothetical protein